jgi:hypothetical protein
MDRSSGLKECPRCGLRNRGGAYQCDFCGWDFKTASDDWLGQLNDLEKLGREVAPNDMDSATRSKIEMTMKKPTEIPVKVLKPERRLELPSHLTLDDHGDVMGIPTAEVVVEAEVDALPLPVEEPSIPVVVPITMPEVASDIDVATEPEEIAEQRSTFMPKLGKMPQLVPAILLGMGLAVYVLNIYVISAGILQGAVAWGLAIVGALLMVYAVIRYLPMLVGSRDEEDEAVLCPVCHELVTDADPRCPSCGVRFKESATRE